MAQSNRKFPTRSAMMQGWELSQSEAAVANATSGNRPEGILKIAPGLPLGGHPLCFLRSH